MDTRNIIGEIIELLNADVPFTDLLIEENSPVEAYWPTGWGIVVILPIRPVMTLRLCLIHSIQTGARKS